ncbi:MAG: hypothetical protein K0Q69_4223 [Devosia sp.]|nr:hypothetical protein [Devosia sp.]
MHPGFGGEPRIGEAGAEGEQAFVDGELRCRQGADGVERLLRIPGPGTQRAAFQRIDVEPVDGEDMVERHLQRRKEAHPRRFELARLQPQAGRKQPVVGEPIVLREFAHDAGVDGHRVLWNCRRYWRGVICFAVLNCRLKLASES